MVAPGRASLEEAERSTEKIARLLGEITPPAWGFVFVLFSIGGPGFSAYASSLERSGVAAGLRELLSKWADEGLAEANVPPFLGKSLDELAIRDRFREQTVEKLQAMKLALGSIAEVELRRIGEDNIPPIAQEKAIDSVRRVVGEFADFCDSAIEQIRIKGTHAT